MEPSGARISECLSTSLKSSDPGLFFLARWYHCTSSTARGGGGSFKKRKIIGEIGCCESRMSKQKH